LTERAAPGTSCADSHSSRRTLGRVAANSAQGDSGATGRSAGPGAAATAATAATATIRIRVKARAERPKTGKKSSCDLKPTKSVKPADKPDSVHGGCPPCDCH